MPPLPEPTAKRLFRDREKSGTQVQHSGQAVRKKGNLSHVAVTRYATVFVHLFEALPPGEKQKCPIQDINDAKRPAFPREGQDI